MALPKPIILRIILIAVVFFVLVVAFVGHFWSDWVNKKLFEWCQWDFISDCPDISMERFYLAWLFFCLFGAIGSLLLVVHFNKNDNKWLRLVDFILHIFLGFLLLIGVITFLVSTIQAKDILDDNNYSIRANNRGNPESKQDEHDEYYQWIIKLLASFFGLAVIVLHAVIAFFIGKPLFQEFTQGGGGNADEGAASQSAVQASPLKQGAEAKGKPSRQSQKV